MDERERKHQAKLRAIEREGRRKIRQMWKAIMSAWRRILKPKKRAIEEPNRTHAELSSMTGREDKSDFLFH